MDRNHENLVWWRSPRCVKPDGDCVEVAFGSGVVHVRDSKTRSAHPLTFDIHEWQAFVAGVRAGEFEP
jgi:hypothetical protein